MKGGVGPLRDARRGAKRRKRRRPGRHRRVVEQPHGPEPHRATAGKRSRQRSGASPPRPGERPRAARRPKHQQFVAIAIVVAVERQANTCRKPATLMGWPGLRRELGPVTAKLCVLAAGVGATPPRGSARRQDRPGRPPARAAPQCRTPSLPVPRRATPSRRAAVQDLQRLLVAPGEHARAHPSGHPGCAARRAG